ncbi:MAG: sulfate reduction electron transfer complex DsrMKJOP subunit DsrM [Nitrospirota bacterium]|nr:MAG: sulfate reduction electron transfer complex DsrMKJOP subunit DsrM [Nitrospirota bacterium]
MGFILSLVIVAILIGVSYAGAQAGLSGLFGIYIPYLALLIFLAGLVLRVLKWAASPVPFRIPTTGGQQKSLPWIKHSKYDNPSSTFGVIVRMLLEIFLFRSLFRNLKAELRDGKLAYGWEKWLWIAGLAFHWCFFIVLFRHFRFFLQPVPAVVNLADKLDGFLQIGVPHLLLTGVVLLGAALYLLARRFYIPQVRYISLTSDYFALLMIIAIATSGILMRYFYKVDIIAVKNLTMGLATLSPKAPEGIGAIFYVHLFLISSLFIYFPFSKLVHFGGVFLSPTRNLANSNRMKKHVNPWNYDVKVHTYEEYEDEFREKMKMVELPVEKE